VVGGVPVESAPHICAFPEGEALTVGCRKGPGKPDAGNRNLVLRSFDLASGRTVCEAELEVQANATVTLHPDGQRALLRAGNEVKEVARATGQFVRPVTLACEPDALDGTVDHGAGYGPLPPRRAVHILRQVCGALAEAHSLGLVHRDVKPGNVMVCRPGGRADAAKLLDFGLGADAGVQDTRLTQGGITAVVAHRGG
jgi:hypothetical protein